MADYASNRSSWARNSWADGAELDALLAQLASMTSLQSAPSAVRQRLLAEARLQSVLPQPSRRQPTLSTVLAGALSAILLLGAVGAGASLLLKRPRLAEAVQATLRSLGIGKMPPPNGAASSPASDTENEYSGTTLSAGAFALPYSDPEIANGTETTVRVSVPASQLMAWGVPAPAQLPDDQVAADLLLGDDGLPRAIRILPATTTSSSAAAEENYP
jgi:hypothetical protein